MKPIIKTEIAKRITESYDRDGGSLIYLGICDGGKHGQSVYVQTYDLDYHAGKGATRQYRFYGYDRNPIGKINGHETYGSSDDESWSEVFLTKQQAIEFALEILKGA